MEPQGAGTEPTTVPDPVTPPYPLLLQGLNMQEGVVARRLLAPQRTRHLDHPRWPVMQNAGPAPEER